MLLVAVPLMKNGRLFGKALLRTASSCRLPTFTPEPRLMLKSEPLNLTVDGTVLSLSSIEYHAPLLAPKRTVSHELTWVSRAANSCGAYVSVSVNETFGSDRSNVFRANVAPRTNRSFAPSVQLP